ncbi:MAG: threonine ammonia-lyase [Deltaproteobacteria bacterium]|nr:threonine ammonia-lyase [Deltaproteobacteria bacterium]
MISKTDIEQAYQATHKYLARTPLVYSQKLSDLCGCRALFKLENFQMTGSFKERGALNKLLRLSPGERQKGVVAASAGNHAQAVAYHCQRLGIKAKIVMPVGSPLVKVVSTQNYGAEVVLHGQTVDDAYELALDFAKKEGWVLVHPFADPLVIAGQGTIGLEILGDELGKDVEAVVCPIGGGGLISGIATYIKETRPEVTIIGVEAAAAPAMKRSLAEGRLIHLEKAASLADGIAVKKPGAINYEIIQRYVDDVVTVEEDEIANAILILLEIEKIVTEGAGAVPLAALLNRKVNLSGRRVVSVISGGNIDVNILDRIITRGLAVEGRVAELTVRLKDLPGSLSALLEIIKPLQANILDIDHHRFDSCTPFGFVDVSLTLETKGHPHIKTIKQAIQEGGYFLQEGRGIVNPCPIVPKQGGIL